MSSKERETTDNFKIIIANILKDIRENFATMKQNEAVTRNRQKIRKYSG